MPRDCGYFGISTRWLMKVLGYVWTWVSLRMGLGKACCHRVPIYSLNDTDKLNCRTMRVCLCCRYWELWYGQLWMSFCWRSNPLHLVDLTDLFIFDLYCSKWILVEVHGIVISWVTKEGLGWVHLFLWKWFWWCTSVEGYGFESMQ